MTHIYMGFIFDPQIRRVELYAFAARGGKGD